MYTLNKDTIEEADLEEVEITLTKNLIVMKKKDLRMKQFATCCPDFPMDFAKNYFPKLNNCLKDCLHCYKFLAKKNKEINKKKEKKEDEFKKSYGLFHFLVD